MNPPVADGRPTTAGEVERGREAPVERADTDPTEIIRLHRGTAQRSLRAVMGVSPDEEDLVQEVMTRLVIRLREPSEIDVGAWTWRVAHNLAIDHIRARRAIPSDPAHLDRPVGDGLDDEAIGAELAAALSRGLTNLPERQREAIVAHASLDGGRGAYALIARTLDMTPAAAESVLGRARRSLRRELDRVGLAGGTWSVLAIALVIRRLLRRKLGVVTVGVVAAACVGLGTTGALLYQAQGRRIPHTGPSRVTSKSPSGRTTDHRVPEGLPVGGRGASGSATTSPSPGTARPSPDKDAIPHASAEGSAGGIASPVTEPLDLASVPSSVTVPDVPAHVTVPSLPVVVTVPSLPVVVTAPSLPVVVTVPSLPVAVTVPSLPVVVTVPSAVTVPTTVAIPTLPRVAGPGGPLPGVTTVERPAPSLLARAP